MSDFTAKFTFDNSPVNAKFTMEQGEPVGASFKVHDEPPTVTNTDYDKLENKPSINGVELVGDKTTEDLGIDIDTSHLATKEEVQEGLEEKQDKGDYALKSELPDISDLATKEEVNTIVENLDVLPDQTDNTGKFLMTDGENTSWQDALVNNSEVSQALAIGKNAKAESFASNAIGSNAVAEAEYGISMGYGAWVTSDRDDGKNILTRYSTALGYSATVTKPNSVALVSDGGVYSSQGVAIGYGASTRTADSISIGNSASTGTDTPSEDITGAIAIGKNAKAKVAYSIAIGNNANANADNNTEGQMEQNSIAIGDNVASTAEKAISLGASTSAKAKSALAVGTNAVAAGPDSIVIGTGAKSESPNGANVVIGQNAKATGYVIKSVAIGSGTKANAYESTAVGSGANTGLDYSVAIGHFAKTTVENYITPESGRGEGNIAIGLVAESSNNCAIAIGDYSQSHGANAIALGPDAKVNSVSSYGIAAGKEAKVVGSEGIAVGHSSNSARHGIALGTRANANNFGTIAIGLNTESTATNALTIGNQSHAWGQDSVALGSSAEVADGAGFAVQLGMGTNYDANTLQFKDYKLLYENGIIPYERFSEYTPSNGQVLTYDENEGALVWGEGGTGGGIAEVNWGDINGDLSEQEDLNDKFMDIRSNFQDVNEAIQSLEMDFSTSTRKLENEIQDVDDRLSYNLQTTKDGLQAQIDNLSAIGQFLAIWDCDTHIARYLTEGYEYQAGNYFIIGSIATDAVNYMPNGSSYPNYVETTEDVKVSDMFFYDGEHWIYLANHERAIAVDGELDATSTNPVENRAVTEALDNVNLAVEELQNRPTGVGVPQLASVDVLQVKTPDEAQDRYYSYTGWMGQYSDIVVTLNLSKQEILEKMYDLYITISRFKSNKNLNYDDDGEAKRYRNISKFSVMNDFRQKTNIRAYCWRMIYDDSLPETNPARYCYFYTQDLYTSEQACLEYAHDIGLWSNYMGPVSYATCFNAIGWTNGYSANDYLHDYGNTTIGIERYEEGDISEFANLGNAGANYTTKRECREYTRDGQKYFFWCQDWDDRNAQIYNKTDDNDNALPNAIPVHMDELNHVWNVFDLPSSFEFVKKRPDLNYRAVDDPYAFFEALEELTFKGKYVDGDGIPTYWNCYWFDYPVMPIMLKDCEARIQFKATKDDYTASVRAGEWHTLEYLYNNNLLHSLSDDLPIELKLPYNTYYLWMRFCSLQKRCAYGDYSNWLDEEGRNIDTPMYPEQKHNLYEGVTSYSILSKRAFARPRQAYRDNGYSKINETIQFNLCEPMDVVSGSKSKATPIQKKLFITSSAKSGLRN